MSGRESMVAVPPGRDFIRCTLADILDGTAPPRRGDGSIAVFNPFGLGVLDIAVGQRVAQWAREAGERATTQDPDFRRDIVP